MTTTEVTVQDISATWNAVDTSIGLSPVMSTACNLAGNFFANTGREFIYVTNSSGAKTLKVKVVSTSNCDHGYAHDVIFEVPAAGGRMVGPFPVAWFSNTTTIVYDPLSEGDTGNTTITIDVFNLPSVSAMS